MKTITVIAVILPIALAVGACAKRDGRPLLVPDPPGGEYSIRDGAWVTDREALARAAAAAGRSPLVQAAIASYGADRLRSVPEYTIRAAGTTTTGLDVEFTTLPFVSDGDETHGVFVTLGSIGGTEIAQRAELIAGREPRPDETGFAPVSIPGGVVWIREADAETLGPGGLAAPERLNKILFLTCMVANAPAACDAGAAIASQIAPGVPYARAVGCAVGVVGAALGCFAGSGTAGFPDPKNF